MNQLLELEWLITTHILHTNLHLFDIEKGTKIFIGLLLAETDMNKNIIHII